MPPGERSVTLLDLLEAGVIEPRKSALSVSYKSIETVADLLPDGTISLKQGGRGSRRASFKSLSAFALHVIHRSFPERQAVDGWQTVKYKGKSLQAVRAEFLGVKAHSEPAEEQPEIVDRVRKAKKVVTITVAVEVPVQEAYVAKAAPGTCPVLRLDVDTLQIILHKLSARDLLQASAVSRRFAAACELLFDAVCNSHPQWTRRTARRQQKMQLERHFPARSRYWLNACRICCEPGLLDIVKANPLGTVHVCWFCKRCVRTQQGYEWLVTNRCLIP